MSLINKIKEHLYFLKTKLHNKRQMKKLEKLYEENWVGKRKGKEIIIRKK